MPNSFHKVCVVIVTYNGIPWIEACLQSLKESTYPNHVVVVDNASTDSTPEVVERFSGVTLLRQIRNLGFGKANNVGIEWSIKHNAEFVFLLNQDTTVDRHCIERLITSAKTGDFGVLSPIHWDSTGKTLDRGFEQYVRKSTRIDELYSLASKPESTMITVNFVNAAAWFLPTSTVRLAGGFAPLFFHYGEDRDYAQRVAYLNLKIGIVTAAGIRHFRDDRATSVIQWPEEKKRRYYFVGMLSRLSNINVSFPSAWWNGLMWVIKESIVLLLKGDFGTIIRTPSILLKLLRLSTRVREHREQVKSNTPYQFLACASE